MICPGCGKEVKGGKFCSYCGSDLTDISENNGEMKKETNVKAVGKEQKEANNKKIGSIKIYLFAVSILFGLFGIGAVVGMTHNNKSEKFVKYIEEENYEKAWDIYENDISNNEKEKQETYNNICEKLNSFVADYYNGSITYEDAVGKMNVYCDYYPEEVDAARDQITYLYSSQQNYLKAEELYESEDYENAQNFYAKVVAEDKNYDNAVKKIEDCYTKYVQKIFADANKLAEEHNFLGAIEILKKSSVIKGDDNTKREIAIEGYYIEYEKETLADAESLASGGKFEEAISVLTYADGTFSQEIFNSQIEEYQKYLTVVLMETEPVDVSSFAFIKDKGVDIYGNTFDKYYELVAYKESDNYVEFLVPGKQNCFTGTIFVPEKIEEGDRIYVEIYVDDVKVYETGEMNRRSQPVNFEINIEGATFIKVVAHSTDRTVYYQGVYPRVGLANSQLFYKKV
ncbi:MAG: NPCBM/NEW2 domain-containing protein [Suilimivivens sp.]